MVEAFTYGDVAVVEQRIIGTEIAVGVIDTGDGPSALPPVEIEPTVGRLQLPGALQRGRDHASTLRRGSTMP